MRKLKWYFTTHGGRYEDGVHLELVNQETNKTIGEVEININVLLMFLEASVNCDDWYDVKPGGYIDRLNKTLLLMELEETGDNIDYQVVGIMGDGYDKRFTFNREFVDTTEQAG